MARTSTHSPALMNYILPFSALVFLGGCVTAPDMHGLVPAPAWHGGGAGGDPGRLAADGIDPNVRFPG